MMQLIQVVTEKDRRDFLRVPIVLYREDPFWIRPLDKDIENVFTQKRNKFFRHGEAVRWVLKDAGGQLIGRVAAFINRKTSRTFSQPTGGMGFFECIDNREAAFLLFDTCKKWLEERGMEAMDGPINFGERDRWWGLMVEGFFDPTYCMNYNPPYYRKLFEDYGFRTYFEQYNYSMRVGDPLPPQYQEKSDRVSRNPLYHCEHIRKNRLEKYAMDFTSVYNKAWSRHENFKGMGKEQAMSIMNSIKPIMEEDLIWFAYYDNQPVGFFIMLPEINQVIKHLRGKLDLWGKLRFLWYRKTGACRKMFGVAFGIVPEHQGKGLEGFIIMAAAKIIQPKNRYDDFEMTWIGDFNQKMIHMVESIGGKKIRTYITYRKLFDESKPFERAPMIK